ncbi:MULTISPECIES: hypothetical protein [unclassified Paenibacillus]|uniref:hypothetical protein n=1 Tax=unclassified Paenibacillus TaxID=185978 RepID=UPI0008CC674E|nr:MULTISPECIES: hypothetical protein [unclassified Paenibacillus]QLG39988.1 hypothetical protein HW560_19000 [Paenibacillus sp. E222]SEN89922.1 hypothetical protein SAMN05518670_3005 [Paenibacillus sp. OK076]
MQTWIFAGLCEKNDLMLYLCKILASSGKRVLLVDGTLQQKYGYGVGESQQSLRITEFEGFDIACQFVTSTAVESHLEANGEKLESYDYVLYDMETSHFASRELWLMADTRVWVSDYERYNLERGKGWLKRLLEEQSLPAELPFQRILINAVDCKLEARYLWAYLEDSPFVWTGESLILPWDELTAAVKLENEHHRRIRLGPLSRNYKRSLCRLVEQLTGWENVQSRRAIKEAERMRA